ncbi:hypothetical protein GCM10009853_029310 [Glycomyces scopariae]
MDIHLRHVRTFAATAGALAAALALGACDAEPSDDTDEGTTAVATTGAAEETSAPEESESAVEGVGDLEGVWDLDAEPPEASTVTVDADGYARYTTEGTIVDYWEGTAVAVSDTEFTIDFAPAPDSEETGEDLEFTAEVTLQPDGDTLAWSSGGYDSTYLRAE